MPGEKEKNMPDYHNESTERLFRAITAISSPEECRAFFEDLCTIREIQDMSQRFDTAILLSKGYSYQKIAEKYSISTATISRVNRCLAYGDGGYKTAIKKLEETENANDNK